MLQVKLVLQYTWKNFPLKLVDDTFCPTDRRWGCEHRDCQEEAGQTEPCSQSESQASCRIQVSNVCPRDYKWSPILKIVFEIKGQLETRIPRMELMPTATKYCLELKSFGKLSLKF